MADLDVFEEANAEIEDGLGIPWVYFDHNKLYDIVGVLSNPWQPVDSTRGPRINSRRTELWIRTNIVANPKEGDMLFKGKRADFTGEFTHEINQVRADEESTAVFLLLKEVRQVD